jgi:hypothetical protein
MNPTPFRLNLSLATIQQSVLLLGGALVLSGTVFAAPAVAQLTLTNEDCIAGLVVAGGAGYSACQGSFYGNDAKVDGEPLLSELNNGLFSDWVGDTTWTYYGKSDEGIFEADTNSSGLWNLLPSEVLNSPFVLSLKASNGFSTYLFTDVSQVTGGSFDTAGVATNQKGTPQDLSHATIYILNDDSSPQSAPFELSSALGLLVLGCMVGLAYIRDVSKCKSGDIAD